MVCERMRDVILRAQRTTGGGTLLYTALFAFYTEIAKNWQVLSLIRVYLGSSVKDGVVPSPIGKDAPRRVGAKKTSFVS